jgi:DNA-directed RNA polymerase specialized sigma24 family protein
MSSGARVFSREAFDNKDVFFWIRPVDERGLQVDPSFAEAAYEKARDFRLYRAQDLRDEAVRAELVEKAVYAASRARKRDIIRDAKSYVFATFARLVDERIKKDRGIEHQLPVDIDRYTSANPTDASSADIDDVILQQQILDAMSPEDRFIWKRRLIGYGVNEIAAELNITPNCLSVRIKRGIEEVRHILRSRRARQ